MNAKLTGLAIAVVAALAVIGITIVRHADPAQTGPSDLEVPPTPEAERASPAKPRTAPLRATCSFKAGQRFAFEMRDQRTWTVDVGQDPASPYPPSTGGVAATVRLGESGTIRWRLDLAVIELRPDKTAVFAASVTQPRFHNGHSERRLGPGPVTTPFLVRIGKRCDVLDVARRSGGSMAAAYWQHRLLAQLSWRLPAQPGKDIYEEVQRNATGVYDARYTVLRGEQHTVIDRQVTNVRELYPFDPGHPGAASVAVSGPGISVLPGERGWFVQMRRNETITWLDGGVPYARVTTRSFAHEVPPSAAPVPKIGDTIDGWSWGDLFAIRSVILDGDASERWQSLAVDSLQRQITALLVDAPVDPAAAVDLARDWVRGGRDHLPILVETLRADDGMTQAESAVILLGLALSSHPPAQNLLGGLLVDPTIGVAHRIRAAFALGGSAQIGEATVDRLVTLARPGAAPSSPAGKMERAAVAVLGHIGRRQRIHDPLIAQRAMNLVRDRYSTASAGDQLVTVFAGLENAGDDTFAPNLKDAHRGGDAHVRAALARSLRRVNPMVAHHVWDQWIDAERDPRVRRAIADALISQILIFRDETTALRSLRGAAIRIVAEQLGKGHPRARAALVIRRDAESRTKSGNPSVVGELETLLRRFPEPPEG